jgi:cytochrome c
MDKEHNVEFAPGRSRAFAKGATAYLGLNKIDLTNIDTIDFSAAAFGPMGPALGGKIEIRIDSPTGRLIGSTPDVTPTQPVAGRRGGRGARVKANITGVTGKHDIYFVIVNSQAKNTEMTLSLSDARFSEK